MQRCEKVSIFFCFEKDFLKTFPSHCGVRAMPTFQFFKNGKKVDEFVGADITKLQSLLQKHSK
jgi:thioredoxin 1